MDLIMSKVKVCTHLDSSLYEFLVAFWRHHISAAMKTPPAPDTECPLLNGYTLDVAKTRLRNLRFPDPVRHPKRYAVALGRRRNYGLGYCDVS